MHGADAWSQSSEWLNILPIPTLCRHLDTSAQHIVTVYGLPLDSLAPNSPYGAAAIDEEHRP